MVYPEESVTSDEPPEIEQPNVYPVDWTDSSPEIAGLYARAKEEHWGPADIPWDQLVWGTLHVMLETCADLRALSITESCVDAIFEETF